jgi:hypothetical protein
MTALVASRRTGHLRTVPAADVDHIGSEWFIVCRDDEIPEPAPDARDVETSRQVLAEARDADTAARAILEYARALEIDHALAIELREEMRKRGLL